MERLEKYKTILLAFLLIALAIVLLYPIVDRQNNVVTLTNTGIIAWKDHLDLDVSPFGYPVVGGLWKITVYMVRKVSEQPTFQVCPNSTVLIITSENQQKKVYTLQTDEKGELNFQYGPEISDVSFQAYSGSYSSSQVIVSSHFVSSNAPNNLLFFDIPSLLASLGSVLLIPKKNIKSSRLLKAGVTLLVCTICISVFATSCLLYARFFLETTWGYPENIIGIFVTFTHLLYLSFAGIILLILSGIMIQISRRSSKEN